METPNAKVRRAATTKIGGGADYAKVAERIRLFREDCPRGLIETEPTFLEGGSLMFKARILKDKADPHSGESKAHAHSGEKNLEKEKAFEKLESIAVGRALANLGYLASGEIASSEEMEEYEQFVSERKQEQMSECEKQLRACKDIGQLAKVWSALPIEGKEKLTAVKEELKAIYAKQEKPKEEAKAVKTVAEEPPEVAEPTVEEIVDSLPEDMGGTPREKMEKAKSAAMKKSV